MLLLIVVVPFELEVKLVGAVDPPIMPLNVKPPAPANVNAFAPLIVPLNANVSPVLAVIVISLPNVIAPLTLLAPEPAVTNAVVPFKVRLFAIAALFNVNCPALTVALPVPNPRLRATCNVPALIVVPPLYVFAPDKVCVPLPAFTKLPVSLITPEKVVELLSAPVVNVPEPNNTLPLPASEPMVSVISFKSNIPSAVTAVLSDNRPEPLNCNVPALIVVVPLYVFAAANVNMPVFCLIKLPDPLNTPLNVLSALLSIVKVAVPKLMLPSPVKPPMVLLNPPKPNVPVDAMYNVLAAGIAFAEPNSNVPALIVVVPVYVLSCPNVNVPLPSLVKPPVPLINPE